jgi:hypothetical protein
MAVTMKITVSWDVTLCSLIVTNVSDEFTASIFRTEAYPEAGGSRIL